jgi:PAS domain S-box-containing protein
MSLWRPRMFILVAALVAAIAGVMAQYHRIQTTQNNMLLHTRVLTAFEDSHTGMMSVGKDGRKIAQANKSAADIFGFTESELVGADLDVLLPMPFRDGHIEKVQQAIADAGKKGGKAKVATVRCIGARKDGSPVDVFVRIFVTGDGVVTLISLADEMSYSVMGTGSINLPTPVVKP